MEKEQILFKIIEVLKNANFKHIVIDNSEWWKDINKRKEAIEKGYHFPLIFDQEFAKFIWGTGCSNPDNLPDWMFHLARVAICNDRLWYLDIEFLQKIK